MIRAKYPGSTPAGPSLENLRVEIWSDKCASRIMDIEINNWFSDHLGQNLRLVYMPDTTRRRADGRYAPKGHYVSFADGYPVLLVGQASLDELNRRLAQPLPMNRFRPNFVFTGGEPFEEDTWRDFTVGEVPFRGVKPCARWIDSDDRSGNGRSCGRAHENAGDVPKI